MLQLSFPFSIPIPATVILPQFDPENTILSEFKSYRHQKSSLVILAVRLRKLVHSIEDRQRLADHRNNPGHPFLHRDRCTEAITVAYHKAIRGTLL